MARQSKHIRFQVAHKAAQMMAEEGISDYAFAKRKAAKFTSGFFYFIKIEIDSMT